MSGRVFDLVVALLAAPVALPVGLAAAGLTALDLRTNPIFSQPRVGKDGHVFTMYKIRTMRDEPQPDPVPAVSDWESFVFSPPGRSNPRVTRLGSLLRRTSIDELPNLVNVVKGEMSIVGPRPEIPEIVRQYPPDYHRRHAVRPGITGLAQVEGRSDLAYAEIIKYDLAYVDEHSLLADIKIIARTVTAAIRGQGAR